MIKQRILLVILFILFLSEIATAGVPVPWGAKLLREDIAVTGDGEERKLTSYETKANKQELYNYYLREMPNQGYSLFMNGEHNLIFNKKEDLVVVLIPPSKDGKTQFTVSTASIKPASNNANGSSGGVVKCEPIPSVPAYPGARCIQSMREKSGGSMSASYSADDSINPVLNFYRLQMPRYAWRLDRELDMEDLMSKALQEYETTMTPEQQTALRDFSGSGRSLIFTNDQGNVCSLQVMINPINKGVILINIVYEEKTTKQ
jgi:hypothetical protein